MSAIENEIKIGTVAAPLCRRASQGQELEWTPMPEIHSDIALTGNNTRQIPHAD